MIEYELDNPSDCYTFRATTLLIAAGAVVLLGEGAFGAHPVEAHEKEERVPIFLLGGHKEWFEERGAADIQGFIKAHAEEIAACLDTVLIGDHDDRRRMERVLGVISDPGEREKALAEWHDTRRTSMNNIGLRAKQLAVRLHEIAKGGVAA